ncbi:hypothetical protein GWI33_020492 [Rhynchophorus ferrugineus]|uniref:Uncharacterized protein n=1 Tax=Rhynchophorus ferrugineus TaxID=354439 RepID=A0A834HPB6_RHYFE|nr:hypothetical protein GWI33_020492 [Rhynchophorus ferrugineus]
MSDKLKISRHLPRDVFPIIVGRDVKYDLQARSTRKPFQRGHSRLWLASVQSGPVPFSERMRNEPDRKLCENQLRGRFGPRMLTVREFELNVSANVTKFKRA